MDNVGDSFQRGLNTFIDFLPRLLMGLLLIIVAWVVATLVKKAIIKGLKATGLASKLQDWGAANNENQGHSMVNALGKVGYFLVWVFFLPGIFYTLGLEAIGQPIQNMLDTAFAFLPNIFSAIVILVLGFYAANSSRIWFIILQLLPILTGSLISFLEQKLIQLKLKKTKGPLHQFWQTSCTSLF